jgi:hypothetical protein
MMEKKDKKISNVWKKNKDNEKKRKRNKKRRQLESKLAIY